MPLTVLTDAEVKKTIDSLSSADVRSLHKVLADALHSYSTATASDDSGCCASNQPSRISLRLKNGSTTLFMPASSDNGVGCKVVTLSESARKASTDGSRASGSLPLRSSSTSTSSSSRSPNRTPRSSSPSLVHSSTASISGSSHSSQSVRSSSGSRSTQNSRPSTPVGKAFDLTEHSLAASSSSSSSKTSPKGTLTLYAADGAPRALISAQTLTAFRTALASTLLLKLRHHVHTLTVFGAGQQAYWHVYLTILLLGNAKLHHLNLINRDFNRAQQLFISLAHHPNPEFQDAFLGGRLRPGILTPEYKEYERLLKEQVRAADILYCCTPSTEPLFPAGHLTNTEGRRKARYVAAVGSYKPHMQELPVEVLQQAVRGPGESQHHRPHLHHKAAGEGGAVVVDSIDGAMKEAGEVIKAGIGGDGVVELGELTMLKRSHWRAKAEKEERERERKDREGLERESGGGHGVGHLFHRHHQGEEMQDGGLHDWLARGNVIYKSVGIGLMDVVVGMEVVRLAEERGIGTHIKDF